MIREANGKFYHDNVEITETEYNELLTEINEKADLVTDIANGEKTIDDCPVEWREEIARRVEEREAEGEPEPELDEILDIILGGMQ